MFLSRIHKKKGIEYLIDCWAELHDKYKDWNIVIAGNGDELYINQLKELVAKNKLKNSIKIIPSVYGEEKHKLYCESSLFVLPSYSENFGMVVAEAMSCGVPVITTTGTPWEILNSLKIGWCIKLGHNELCNSLVEAMDLGKDILFDMGQKSSKYINNNFNLTVISNQLKKMYELAIR